ncbi:MAG: hypothetical protein V4805_05775 [Pseudomonadota bacterium]
MSIKTHHFSSSANSIRTAIRCSAVTLVALALSGLALGAMAADNDADAQERYKAERAACQTGQSHQDRSTCLQEAKAALNEARKRHLNGAADSYEKNALSRCEALPAGDRAACQRRVQGEGSISGSVEEGGVLRELVVKDEQ